MKLSPHAAALKIQVTCGEAEHGEAVYIEQDEWISVGLGLKMKHEYASVCCQLGWLPLNKISYCATNSFLNRLTHKKKRHASALVPVSYSVAQYAVAFMVTSLMFTIQRKSDDSSFPI